MDLPYANIEPLLLGESTKSAGKKKTNPLEKKTLVGRTFDTIDFFYPDSFRLEKIQTNAEVYDIAVTKYDRIRKCKYCQIDSMKRY